MEGATRSVCQSGLLCHLHGNADGLEESEGIQKDNSHDKPGNQLAGYLRLDPMRKEKEVGPSCEGENDPQRQVFQYGKQLTECLGTLPCSAHNGLGNYDCGTKRSRSLDRC